MKKKKIVLRMNEQGQVAIERYIGNVVLAKRRQRCFHTVHMYMHHTFEISTNSYVCNEDLWGELCRYPCLLHLMYRSLFAKGSDVGIASLYRYDVIRVSILYICVMIYGAQKTLDISITSAYEERERESYV